MDHGTVSLGFPSSRDSSGSDVALVHGVRVGRTLRRLILGSGKSQGSLSVRSETPKATVEVSSRVTRRH